MPTVTVTTAGETVTAAYNQIRPTGTGYVRYEDLYQPGDTVTAAMARLTTPAIITFPEGVFECVDFATGYNTGISIPKNCKGIWGSGAGTLGGTTGTIFTMKPSSSTKKPIIPAQDNSTPCPTTLMMSSGSPWPQSYGQFQVAGTEQGHIFHLFTVYNPGGPSTVTDVLLTGWSGNNGAPPGETFGLTMHGSKNHTLTRVETDGRRTVGGPAFGGAGITFQNTVGGSADDCYCHDNVSGIASFVGYQSFNVKTRNLRVGAPGAKVTGKGTWINHERTAGFEHWNPVVNTGSTNTNVHVTHSNDTYALTVDGVTYQCANGSLRIVNPVFNDIWGNGKFYTQAWVPYWTGNTMTADNPPLVTTADGATHLPYKYAYGNTQYTIT